MSLTSLWFFLFLAAVCLLYYNLPPKLKNPMLLLASLGFYALYTQWLALVLPAIVAATYFLALALERRVQAGKKAGWLLALSLFVVLGALFAFKYLGFFAELLGRALALVGANTQFTSPLFDIIGLSFYSLTAAGYLIDIYRKKYSAERNFIDFALFVCFFAHLLNGPIARADSLLPQLKKQRAFEFEPAREGAATMLWGCFVKLVISSNLLIVVETQYAAWAGGDGIRLLLAALFYGIYIYADFSSYTFIARGAAKLLGLELAENFKMPYLARSIRDFWRRWHISLSSWFRDYLYIPLGGSRVSKFRYYLNTMIVFLISGLWHGASANFIVWGGLHGAYRIAGDLTEQPRAALKRKLKMRPNGFWERIVRPVITFSLVNFAWVFFALPSFSAARSVLSSIARIHWAEVPGYILWSLGLSRGVMIAVLASIVLLFAVDILRLRGPLLPRLFERVKPFWRYAIWYALILLILLFGAFGQSGFVYFDF